MCNVLLSHSVPDTRSIEAQLIQYLFHAFMRWRIGSRTTSLPVKGDVHELVVLGIGHLQEVEPFRTLNPTKYYPVYLCGPFVVLYLSSVFDKHPHTKKEAWITEAFCTLAIPSWAESYSRRLCFWCSWRGSEANLALYQMMSHTAISPGVRER